MPRYWKGKRVYDCSHCPFDSLNEEALAKHIKDVHTVPEPPPQPKPVLYDRFNNEIKE